MGHDVYANNRLITAKCADGKSIAAFPDVCMTPPPPPGVPVPYPNTSFASDLTDGSKTVKIVGTEVCLKDKSNFKTSTGDEAGCAPKHGVVTGKIKGKTFFTSWSMNVKVEGLNVTRHLDLTTHNHGSQPGNTPPAPELDKMTAPAEEQEKPKTLRATIMSVSFDSDVPKVYRYAAKDEVAAPHWTKGVDMEDGKYSKKPAVFLMKRKNGKRNVKVKVKIEESTYGGNGKLSGNFGDLEITGDCPLGEGEHTVSAQFKELPDQLTWINRDARWELTAEAETAIPLESTHLEVFVIFDKPQKMFDEKGVWAEVLRWLFDKVKVAKVGEGKDKHRVAAEITKYCFGKHGLRYDTIQGATWYSANPYGSKKFNLYGYIKKKIKIPPGGMLITPGVPECNCYDQAAAIQSLSGALGLKYDQLFMDPFGFINTIGLVGIGNCNNPFSWKIPAGNAIVPEDDDRRQGFGNHAFCSFDDKIHDACGGPAIGEDPLGDAKNPGDKLTGYLGKTIDTTTKLYRTYGMKWGEKAEKTDGVLSLDLNV